MATRGKTTLTQRIALEGGEEVRKQFEALGKAGQAAFGAIDKAARSAEFEKFGKSLKQFGNDLERTVRRTALVIGALATGAAAAGAAVFKLAKDGADAADAMGKMAQETGLSIEAFGGLQFAAEQAGASTEEFRAGMARFNRTLSEAATGNKSALAAFKALGVSIKDAQGNLRPTEDVLRDVADAFASMPDGATKSAAAMDLLGRSGARLIPLLNGGSEGMEKLIEQFNRLGLGFTDSQFRNAEKFNDTLDTLRRTINSFRLQAGLLFLPALTTGAQELINILERNRQAILGFTTDIANRAIPIIEDLFALLGGRDADVSNAWILTARDAVQDFASSTQVAFNTVIIPAFNAFREVLDAVAESINGLFGSDLTGTSIAIIAVIGSVTGAFKLLRSAVVLAWRALGVLRGHPALAAIALLGLAVLKVKSDIDAARETTEFYADAQKRVEEAMKGSIPATRDASAAALEKAQADYAAALALRERAKRELEYRRLIAESIPQTPGAPDPIAAAEARLAERDRETRELGQRLFELAEAQSRAANASKEQAGALGEVGTKAGEAKENLDSLKTVTVTRFDEAGNMTKQTFDLVDGIAKAAEKSKTELDAIGTSAETAAERIKTVNSEVQTVLRSVPEALRGQEGAAQLGEELEAIEGQVSESVGAIKAELETIRPAVTDAFTNLSGSADTAFDGLINAAKQAAAGVVAAFRGLGTAIAAEFRGVAGAINSQFAAIESAVTAMITRLEAELRRLRAAISRARAEARSSGASSGASGSFAGGGHVRGPGTSMSDSILAWLSDGEFVIRAAAVRKYGTGIFALLNAMRAPADFLKHLQGFADGGHALKAGLPALNVGGLLDGFRQGMAGIPPLAVPVPISGALAPQQQLQPFNLVIGGQTFSGLLAPVNVADEMQRMADDSAMASAGRAPGWVR